MISDLDARVAAFVAEAYDHAPGVRRWFEAAGLTPSAVRGVADLAKIPVLTKDRMVERAAVGRQPLLLLPRPAL